MDTSLELCHEALLSEGRVVAASVVRRIGEENGDLRQRCESVEKGAEMMRERINANNIELLRAKGNCDELLAAIPACPVHGSRCVPYAIEWVKGVRDPFPLETCPAPLRLTNCAPSGELRLLLDQPEAPQHG
jgi:hypothetical protein